MAQFQKHVRTPHNAPSAQPFPRYGGNLVLRGSGAYTDWNDCTHKLTPGVFYQRFPDKPHCTWLDPNSNYADVYVCIDPVTAHELLKLELLQPIPVMTLAANMIVLEQFVELLKSISTPESGMNVSSLTVHTLHFIHGLYERAQHGNRDNHWHRIVADARCMLEHDLTGKRSLEQIAEALHVSYPTFRKVFKQMVGLAGGEYRIRLRMERACIQLVNDSVKNVAASLGYCDAFTFSDQFKAHIGISPREFQKRTGANTHIHASTPQEHDEAQ